MRYWKRTRSICFRSHIQLVTNNSVNGLNNNTHIIVDTSFRLQHNLILYWVIGLTVYKLEIIKRPLKFRKKYFPICCISRKRMQTHIKTESFFLSVHSDILRHYICRYYNIIYIHNKTNIRNDQIVFKIKYIN